VLTSDHSRQCIPNAKVIVRGHKDVFSRKPIVVFDTSVVASTVAQEESFQWLRASLPIQRFHSLYSLHLNSKIKLRRKAELRLRGQIYRLDSREKSSTHFEYNSGRSR
jgi:hypothetical protein